MCVCVFSCPNRHAYKSQSNRNPFIFCNILQMPHLIHTLTHIQLQLRLDLHSTLFCFFCFFCLQSYIFGNAHWRFTVSVLVSGFRLSHCVWISHCCANFLLPALMGFNFSVPHIRYFILVFGLMIFMYLPDVRSTIPIRCDAMLWMPNILHKSAVSSFA